MRYDPSQIEIRDGRIRYQIQQQDGTAQDMDCPDTIGNRAFVRYVQTHEANHREENMKEAGK